MLKYGFAVRVESSYRPTCLEMNENSSACERDGGVLKSSGTVAVKYRIVVDELDCFAVAEVNELHDEHAMS